MSHTGSKVSYISTRSSDYSSAVPFSKAVLEGIASDGGLFVPTFFPKIHIEEPEWMQLDYQGLAKKILKLYLDDFTDAQVDECVESAYDFKFTSPKIAPVSQIGKTGFIELYHGKTLAFKDMALSILPHFMQTSRHINAVKDRILVLTATSGDTGKAALEGFADVQGMDIMVFYPTDGVSEIQKKQMITQSGSNVHVYGIRGNFDDAQNGVKAIFADAALKTHLKTNNVVLSSANSINIGRLLPQIVYYVHAYLELIRAKSVSLGDAVNIAVPTGNFGNILAAYYAKKMGMPFKNFICASNVNHVLTDFIKTGRYDINRDFKTTQSPSMDILISSNLERFLYELSGRSHVVVSELMHDLKQSGVYEITENMHGAMHDFYAGYADDSESITTIHELFKSHGYVVDPHTAIAYKVYKDYVKETGDDAVTLIASTASPFKFADSVAEGIDARIDSTTLDAFEVIASLSKTTGLSVPDSIAQLAFKPALQDKIIEINGLTDEVLNAIK